MGINKDASMGPHSFERGNIHGPVAGQPTGRLLQWGLTLSSEETRSNNAKLFSNQRASMGPHSFERGNLRIKLLILKHVVLQWGLTLSSEETLLSLADTSAERLCFNGASLFRARKPSGRVRQCKIWYGLQWGLTLSSEETHLPNLVVAQEGQLQWGLTLSSEETQRVDAAAIRGRRLQWGLTLSSEETRGGIMTLQRSVIASMGPHSFERGNYTIRITQRRDTMSFNGASLFRARKRDGETVIHNEFEDASMGPHSFERGNYDAIATSVAAAMLQWGLTLSSEETASVVSRNVALVSSFNGASLFRARKRRWRTPLEACEWVLQWGLTLSSEETSDTPRYSARDCLASMGPHSFERGNRPPPPDSPFAESRFNGASLFRARKRGRAREFVHHD